MAKAVKKKAVKKGRDFSKKPVPGKAAKKKKKSPGYSRVQWVCIGGDVGMSAISLGGIAKLSKSDGGGIRAGAVTRRWTKDEDYFNRMKQAASAHEIVQDLFSEMKLLVNLDQVFFAVEEAVPLGALQGGTRGRPQGSTGAYMKQQIQISGAFLGGLFRWGWKNVYEIQANQWRQVVAADLGITIHHSKWNPDKKIGKFRAKQWIEQFHPEWDGHWPDMIRSNKLGLISQPETSKAQPVQSDDRYEALAMAQWMREERKNAK